MLSVPYSRYIFAPLPWYSFLIVTGMVIAICMAMREEKRVGLKKDTVLDLVLFLIPAAVIGARVYYVIFSWPSFRDDPLSVLRIWEGGLAIYGGVIAGFLTVFIFSRKRKLSVGTLCDLIAPGLALGQAIGRWGNYFNMEAYGAAVTVPALRFFPFAVQILTENGWGWYMATFFYESVWDALIFAFLLFFRRKRARRSGDVFLWYLALYGIGRFIIENFRADSLYGKSGIRVSQLLSELAVLAVLTCFTFFREDTRSGRDGRISPLNRVLYGAAAAALAGTVLCSFGVFSFPEEALTVQFLILAAAGLISAVSLFLIYGRSAPTEVLYAYNKD